MKICFLAGANSIHSVRWVKYFHDNGHNISWISFAPPIPEAEDLIKKVKFYEIKPSPLNDINGRFAILYLPLAVWRVKKILKKEKPDVMHIHSAGTYGLTGSLSGFKPIVLTPWGSDVLLTSSLKKPLIEYVVRKASLISCDGDNTTETLISLGVKKEKIYLIRFGTDIEKFKPDQKPKSKGLKLKAISLRSLEPVYDIETLIKAANIVIKKFKDVEFLIVGGGSQKEHLENLSKSFNLENNVKFLGKIQNQFLPQLLRSSDIYISTSLSDSGLSASTAEAMSSGLPVIVSNSGDNQEWIKDFENGFIFPLKDHEILAEKLIYLIENQKERILCGENGRKLIEEKNNYYKEMEKMERLYEKVIKEN